MKIIISPKYPKEFVLAGKFTEILIEFFLLTAPSSPKKKKKKRKILVHDLDDQSVKVRGREGCRDGISRKFIYFSFNLSR